MSLSSSFRSSSLLSAVPRHVARRSQPSQPPHSGARRRFSEVAKSDAPLKTEATAVEEILRHGPGDGVIILNVGGQEFVTLRSTVHSNRVLREHVLRAEANKEFTKGGTAVFIDRDPTNFNLILQHLRNQADQSSYHSVISSAIMKKDPVLIQIPNDKRVIRDLFVEARHFEMKDLEKKLCTYDTLTQIVALIGGGSGNPFNAASQMLQNARRALVATGGLSVFMGAQNDELTEKVKGFFGDVLNTMRGKRVIEQAKPKEVPAEPTFG